MPFLCFGNKVAAAAGPTQQSQHTNKQAWGDGREPQASTYPITGGLSDNQYNGRFRHMLAIKGPTGFSSSSTADEVAANWNGTGKTVIITGATGGLGGETARVLASKGAEVVLAVRDVTRGEALAKSIRSQHPAAKLLVMQLELSSQASVRAFAAAFKATNKPLNVLMLNAAVMAVPFALSEDGRTDSQFATNHTGHFLLTQLLLDMLIATAKASKSQGRVVVMTSCTHFVPYTPELGGPIRLSKMASQEGYDAWMAYGETKLSNLLFARELNQRLKGEPVAALACHPGVVDTGLNAHLGQEMNDMYKMLTKYRVFKSVAQGAATGVLAATFKDVLGGEYYADCNVAPSSPASIDANLGRALWEFSEKLVAGGGQLAGSAPAAAKAAAAPAAAAAAAAPAAAAWVPVGDRTPASAEAYRPAPAAGYSTASDAEADVLPGQAAAGEREAF